MKPTLTSPELDHVDAQILRHFLGEIERAAAGEISPEWIRRSFEALPITVKRIFTAQQKENPA